jgi:NAD-dependent dihydropyrimidine dehydrogenase PreA subunit
MGTDHQHRICTFGEAETAIRSHETIYINDCFCRTPAKQGKSPWEYCGHPTETCMGFHEPKQAEESYLYKVITQEKALEVFENWKKGGGFFRFMVNDGWICCCCGCGCGWFRDEKGNKKADPCDKSAFIEKTDEEKCNLCGSCVDVCAFEARKITDEAMVVRGESCYGCSACEFACPEEAIEMVGRT